mmetsp:Transcript_11237/g.25203  ORF Transcript_11237/g.25203 Transcript_11237/m.25203 type:complete len:200 (-) Transcript_11237:175-774(-)
MGSLLLAAAASKATVPCIPYSLYMTCTSRILCLPVPRPYDQKQQDHQAGKNASLPEDKDRSKEATTKGRRTGVPLETRQGYHTEPSGRYVRVPRRRRRRYHGAVRGNAGRGDPPRIVSGRCVQGVRLERQGRGATVQPPESQGQGQVRLRGTDRRREEQLQRSGRPQGCHFRTSETGRARHDAERIGPNRGGRYRRSRW